MRRKIICYAMLCLSVLTGCRDLDEGDIEHLLQEQRVYPSLVEMRVFCNGEGAVANVIEAGLVRDGFVTAQLKHTPADIGKPLIYFTDKATPYLLPTSDTLKSFYEQRVKVAVEHFLRVVNIEISASGKKAVVDYMTEIKDPTPFAVLYNQDIGGEHPRRTFFSRMDNGWQWDGRVVKMSPNRKK
jgi:hypothetical protein